MKVCDMPRVFETTTPTARKKHLCCECRGPIDPGQKYQLCSGIWEDGPARFKTCMPCAEFRDEYRAQLHWSDCLEIGGLYEQLCHEELPDHVKTLWISKGWMDGPEPQPA